MNKGSNVKREQAQYLAQDMKKAYLSLNQQMGRHGMSVLTSNIFVRNG